MRTITSFIKFYEKIPEDKWTTNVFYDTKTLCYCSIGHLEPEKAVHGGLLECISTNSTPVGIIGDLIILLEGRGFDIASMYRVNDGENSKYRQSTPKKRIIAFLKDLKKVKVKKNG